MQTRGQQHSCNYVFRFLTWRLKEDGSLFYYKNKRSRNFEADYPYVMLVEQTADGKKEEHYLNDLYDGFLFFSFFTYFLSFPTSHSVTYSILYPLEDTWFQSQCKARASFLRDVKKQIKGAHSRVKRSRDLTEKIERLSSML